MKKIFFVIFATIFCVPVFSGDHIDKDEYEVRYIKQAIHLNTDVQYHLRNEIAWKEFQSLNPNWFVYFNEHNRKPHRAFGEGIFVVNPSDFIINNLSGFNVPFGDLTLKSETENEKYKNYIYTQSYQDLEVLDSRLYLKMNKNNEVIIFGLDVFSDINLSIIPTLSSSEALLSAKQNLPLSITESNIEENLKILPIPENGKYTYHLVYIVNLLTRNNIGPAHYICYVDANNGDLLMRRNEIKFELPQANVHVEGEVYTTSPFNPSSIVDFVDLKVRYNNMNYFTDNFGEVMLPSNSGNVTYYLEGLYSEVRTNGNVASFNAPASNNNILFDNTNSTISERTAFYAVNNIHTHFKNQFPAFTALDFSLETNVDDQTDNCNAFYSGGGWGGSSPSINFYAEGGGCQSTAQIPDVAYHEYGHAINDHRYNSGSGMQNGGLNEGTADIWALSLTQYPVLGEGWYLNNPNSNVREYDLVKKVYPQDLVGEVHADGEIICGAFWDTYINLGDMQQTLDLFVDLYDGGPDGPNGTEGVIYTDILLEFLYSDDDDQNIFNGTPNDNAIVDAFALHGITLLSNAVLTHTGIDESLSGIQIDLDVNIVMTYPWALNDAYCYYKLNNSTIWDSIPLSIVSGNNYTAQIPPQSEGTVVAYYLLLVDTYGKKAAITPFSANLDKHANLPYFILCGYTEYEKYDLDNINGSNYGHWDVNPYSSDLATTGKWEDAEPDGNTTTSGNPVQPSDQHTPGGNRCVVTGNRSISGVPAPYAADDIDGGHTTVLLKPDIFSDYFDLTSYVNPAITYYRWYSNNTGANPGNDWWQVQVSDDGGNNWIYVENNKTSDNSWRKFTFRVKDYVSITDEFLIRFIASDSNFVVAGDTSGGSVVEAAIDDFAIYDQSNPTSILENIINIDIYPNPTTGVVYIDNFDNPLNIKVMNTLGEIVMEKQLSISDNKIDLSTYDKGIYYLEIISKKGKITKKIVLE